MHRRGRCGAVAARRPAGAGERDGAAAGIHEARRWTATAVSAQASHEQRIVWATELESCSKRCGEYFGSSRRVLAVPLVHKGRVLGIYNLFFSSEDELSPDIAALLRSIGELLGPALDNLRLEAGTCAPPSCMSGRPWSRRCCPLPRRTFIKMRLPLLRDAIWPTTRSAH
jgi:two-component system nitrate/nitrite sensor histidine kinase NarX